MEAIKVYIRLRPVEQNQKSCCTISNCYKRINVDGNRKIQCQFDYIFGTKCSQNEVYEKMNVYASCVLQGYNATIMTYGMLQVMLR